MLTKMRTRAAPLALALAAGAALAGCAQTNEAAEEAADALAAGVDGAVETVETALKSPRERFRSAQEMDEIGKDADAVAIYRDLAEDGYGPAAYQMGEAYESGEGVARDLDRAARWYNRAAEAGAPRAQFLVARAYAEGAGVEQDMNRAAELFGKAAVQGYAPAQYRLARAFANGEGVPRDRLWAGRWYGKAARQGNADAQFAYGAMLAAGSGVPRDRPLGQAYLSAAADNGVNQAAALAERVGRNLSSAEQAAADDHLAAIRGDASQDFADRPTVRFVQAALREEGVDAGPVDGLLGPATRRGVETFQGRRDRTSDGRIDAALLETLLEARRAG
ncbi:MAG: SEL1-like repeat protein [Marivibrio sp.]|uniref:SEL1-like repeat protein n=1 Tax=Marivibrio sp. TaxID=2039719 RepID=UPI0032EC3E3C